MIAGVTALASGSARGDEALPWGPDGPDVRHWDEGDGLPSNRVTALLQTHDGYVWVGTSEGLVRFDGFAFHRIPQMPVTPGLAPTSPINPDDPEQQGDVQQDQINDLNEAAGTVWAVGNGVLYEVVNLQLVRHDILPDRIERFWIYGLTSVDANTVLVNTNHGLFQLPNTDSDRSFKKVPTIRGGVATASRVDRDGVRWVAGRTGLFRQKADSGDEYLEIPDLAGIGLGSLYDDPGGDIWVTGQDAVYRVQGDVVKRFDLPTRHIYSLPRDLVRDQDGRLWGATGTGLIRLADSGVTRQAVAGIDERLQALLVDTEGGLWIGSESGVYRLRRTDFELIGGDDGLPDEHVTAILENADGRILLGFRTKGLSVYDPVDRTIGPVLEGTLVQRLVRDRQGRVWVRLADRIVALDGSQVLDVPVEGPDSMELGADDQILVLNELGVNRLRDGKWTKATGGGAIGSLLHAGSSGDLWVSGGMAGVRRITIDETTGTKTEVTYGEADGLPSGAPYRAFQEDPETMWVSLRGGYARWRRGAWKRWVVPARVRLRRVYQLDVDGVGGLWLCGENGLGRVDLEALHRHLDAGGPQPTMVVYREAGGHGIECALTPGNTRSKDGRLWFATAYGALIVDPKTIARPISVPQVRIETIDVDGETRQLDDDIAPGFTVGPARSLAFTFTAISFSSSERLQFRYRLAGMDDQWLNAGQARSARYTNLPPGPFRLLVEAHDRLDPQNASTTTLAFAHAARFHQTGWFVLLVVLALAALGVSILWLRSYQLRKQFAAVADERNRIARELHDSLDQMIYAVGAQLFLAEHAAPKEHAIKEHIGMARTMLQHTQEESRRSIKDLRSRTLEDAGGNLTQALQLSVDRLQKSVIPELRDGTKSAPTIQLQTSGLRDLSLQIRSDILRITEELVLNAIRHAHADIIQINVKREGRRLTLVIRDDGAGFNPESAPSTKAGHFGVSGVRERLALLGGELTVTSRPGQGATMTVTMKL